MTQPTLHPFDDIKNLAKDLPTGDIEVGAHVAAKLEQSLGGLRPLGHLSAAVSWLAQWQGSTTPAINKPLVSVFIGTHNVAANVLGVDVIAGGKARMAAMTTISKTNTQGIAAVRGLAGSVSAFFKVFDMGVEAPAADMCKGASLSQRECAGAIAYGMEVVAEDADIIALGNAGFGSATAAAGIARALYGGAAQYWAGGDGEAADRRIKAVETATITHKEILGDPLEVLRCFGGRDIAGMVGAILAARHQNIPVLLDGYTVCAAAAIVHALNPAGLDHCLAAHKTIEPAHGALLERIEKKPLLDYGLGIGDGSGAAMTIGVIKAAAAGYQHL